MKLTFKLLALLSGLCVFSSMMAQQAYELSAWQKFKAALKIGTHGMGAEEYAMYEQRKEAAKATMTAEQYAAQKKDLKGGLVEQTHGAYAAVKQAREADKVKEKQEKEAAKQKEKEEKAAAKVQEKATKELEKKLEKKSESLDKQIRDLEKKAKTGQLTVAEKATLSTSMQERVRLQDERVQANPEKFKEMRDTLTAKKAALQAEVAALEKKGWSVSSEKREKLLKLNDQIDQTRTLQQKRDAAYVEAESKAKELAQKSGGSVEEHLSKLRYSADLALTRQYGTALPPTQQEQALALIKEKQASATGLATGMPVATAAENAQFQKEHEARKAQYTSIDIGKLKQLAAEKPYAPSYLPVQPAGKTTPTQEEITKQAGAFIAEKQATVGKGSQSYPVSGRDTSPEQYLAEKPTDRPSLADIGHRPAKEYVTLPAQPPVQTGTTQRPTLADIGHRSAEGYVQLPTKGEALVPPPPPPAPALPIIKSGAGKSAAVVEPKQDLLEQIRAGKQLKSVGQPAQTQKAAGGSLPEVLEKGLANVRRVNAPVVEPAPEHDPDWD